MNTFNFSATWNFFKRHIKFLAIVFIVSAIVTAAISLLLPNYYKSEVLILPSEVNSISKSVLNEGDRLDPYMFGTEKESEYILEMLSSWNIMEKTAKKFSLKEHYGIKNTPLAGERMVWRLMENIKVKRSDYLGVKLQVWDKDPEYAADIANYMIEELEKLRHDMKQAKADSIVHELYISRERIRKEVSVLTDSLTNIRTQSNIVYPVQYSDRLAQQMAKEIAAGNTAGVARLETKMNEVAAQSTKINTLMNDLENKSKTLASWDEHYEQAVLDLNSDIPVDFIAQWATPFYKKDRPKRLLIVLISALACTLLSVEYLIIKEKNQSSKVEDE